MHRYLGQHWLINKGKASMVCNAIDTSNDDTLIEIGAGTGALSVWIQHKPCKAYKLIEKDGSLIGKLKSRIKCSCSIEICCIDLKKFCYDAHAQVVLFSATPYYLSAYILELVYYLNNVRATALIVQKELATNILLNKSKLSLMLHEVFDIEKVMDLYPEDFYPAPKVESSCIRMIRKKHTIPLDSRVLNLMNIAFAQKRKTLRNSIGHLFSKSLIECPLMSMRPEHLHICDFYDLLDLRRL